ncbi:response regulator transcription factor [Cyclobacteriaceae bacterium]|nr:response regulator transcription factor [Cyclobacteriaceae bacterium]
MLNGYKILIADDEENILELLQYNLEGAGYTVRTCTNGKEALKEAKHFEPDLIILDIMMPEQDGIETCRLLRQDEQFQNTFIIFLTARSEEFSEVAAFENGADDYVVKPIKPRALLGRVQSILRRNPDTQTLGSEDIVTHGEYKINRSSYIITYQGKEFTFPKKEFELVYLFSKFPGKVFSRDVLLQKIWGADVEVTPRTVDVHIRKIREKLPNIPLKTIKGIGYKMESL